MHKYHASAIHAASYWERVTPSLSYSFEIAAIQANEAACLDEMFITLVMSYFLAA